MIVYQICCCWNRDYITGNAPYGIFIESEIEYTDIEEVEKEFKDCLKERKSAGEFEFGWDLEYRVAYLGN